MMTRARKKRRRGNKAGSCLTECTVGVFCQLFLFTLWDAQEPPLPVRCARPQRQHFSKFTSRSALLVQNLNLTAVTILIELVLRQDYNSNNAGYRSKFSAMRQGIHTGWPYMSTSRKGSNFVMYFCWPASRSLYVANLVIISLRWLHLKPAILCTWICVKYHVVIVI